MVNIITLALYVIIASGCVAVYSQESVSTLSIVFLVVFACCVAVVPSAKCW